MAGRRCFTSQVRAWLEISISLRGLEEAGGCDDIHTKSSFPMGLLKRGEQCLAAVPGDSGAQTSLNLLLFI